MSILPNILLIITDQFRYDAIHAMNNENISTPNIDRLSTMGTMFTQATTPSPVCMPARWSIYSGQWVETHGCRSNHHPGISPSHSLPGLLKAQGYRTALCGKNHSFLTPKDFDFFNDNPCPDTDEFRELKEWNKLRSIKEVRMLDRALSGGIKACEDCAKTDIALDFLEKSDSSLFFLTVSYIYPHTPYESPDPYFSMYKDKELPVPVSETEDLQKGLKPFRQWFHQHNNNSILPFDSLEMKKMRQVYYSAVSTVDAEIGRILDYLTENGTISDTLIIFTADHGDYMGEHGLITKSPAMYDCLTRIPMIVSWVDKLPKNQQNSSNVSLVDILPTCLEAAGISPHPAVDGKSMLSCIYKNSQIRDFAFSQYGVDGKPYSNKRLHEEGLERTQYLNPFGGKIPWEGNPISLSGKFYMYRTEKWKYVYELDGTDELYDLLNDKEEMNNLATQSEYKNLITRFRGELQKLIKIN